MGDQRKETELEPDSLVSEILEASNFPGAPGRIRTPDLRIRSPLLYPAELQAHLLNAFIGETLKDPYF